MELLLLGIGIGLIVGWGIATDPVKNKGNGYQPLPLEDGEPEGLNPPTGHSSVMHFKSKGLSFEKDNPGLGAIREFHDYEG